MRRLLILDAHADAAVASLQSLGRAGYEVWIAGARDSAVAFASRHARRRLTYPDPQYDAAAFRQWLRDTLGGDDIDLVLPVTDATIKPCMQLREQWPDSPPIVLPPPRALETVVDKERTLALAAEQDVPVPQSRLIQDPDELGESEWHSLPVYVKPVRSKVWKDGRGHSLVPVLADTTDALRRALSHFLPLTPVQVQDYFPGHGVGIEVLCHDGEVLMYFAHRRLHEYPLTGGRSTYREAIEPRPEWVEAARRLMRGLRWEGVAMVELKVEAERYALMEINGRFWGSLPLAVASGADFPRALVALWLDGEMPRSPPYRRGYRMRNLGFDLVWMRDNMRADHADSRLLTRPRLKSLVEWLRPVMGREGWDHFHWHDPGPGLTQVRLLLSDQGGKIFRSVRRRLLRRWRVRTSLARARTAGRRVQRILVLCYGNIYRSPLAAALIGRAVSTRISVRSAGFHEREGRACSSDYLELLAHRGIDLTEHRSCRVTAADLDAADLIVIMDERNLQLARALSPSASRKIIWLGAFDGTGDPEVPDPYGRGQAYTDAVIERVIRACRGLAGALRPDGVGVRRASEDSQ